MAVTPYQPLGKPEKHVSHDRMQEILSKNSSKAAQSPKEKPGPESWPKAPRENAPTAQPPRPAGKLQWAPREEGSMGRYDTSLWYSVCQTNHPEPMFTAWTRNPLTSGMRILECGLPTFKAAIAVCQKDADERYARGER